MFYWSDACACKKKCINRIGYLFQLRTWLIPTQDIGTILFASDWFGLTVLGMPSDCIQVAVAVMEEELVVRSFNSPLKQIHEVMTIYLPADQIMKINSKSSLKPKNSTAYCCESQWLLKPSEQGLRIVMTPFILAEIFSVFRSWISLTYFI